MDRAPVSLVSPAPLSPYSGATNASQHVPLVSRWSETLASNVKVLVPHVPRARLLHASLAIPPRGSSSSLEETVSPSARLVQSAYLMVPSHTARDASKAVMYATSQTIRSASSVARALRSSTKLATQCAPSTTKSRLMDQLAS